MIRYISKVLPIILVLAMILGAGGVFAAWQYATLKAASVSKEIEYQLNKWDGPAINHPNSVYITGMTEYSTSAIDKNEYSYTPWTSDVETTVSRSGTSSGSVTYQVTVFNNTAYTCAYRGVSFDENLSGYDNSYITTSTNSYTTRSMLAISTSFPNGDTVAAGQSLTFNATYTVGRSIANATELKTLVNYQFGINVETEIEAVDTVIDTFVDVLNTSESFEELQDKIDDKYNGKDAWTATFIGNVTGSDNADTATIEALFGGNLTLTINGVDTPMTVIVKSENIDGNNNTGNSFTASYTDADGSVSTASFTGCEMTLYLTADSLSNSGNRPTVYAIVFTCDTAVDDNGNITYGEWYKLGTTYQGTAEIVGYLGNYTGTGVTSGSFNTGDWKSTAKTYTIGDYDYSVGGNQGIGSIITSTAQDTASKTRLRTLLDNAVTILSKNYAGDAIDALQKAYDDAARFYTVADDGTITVNTSASIVQLIPHIEALSIALNPLNYLLTQ